VAETGSFLERFVFAIPLIYVLRVTLIVIAVCLAGLVVVAYFRGMGTVKIGKGGIELGVIERLSEESLAELRKKDERVKTLQSEIETLKADKAALQKLIEDLVKSGREHT